MSSGSLMPGTDEQLFTTIVTSIAAAKNVDPIDLEPPLYDVINPESLGDVIESADASSTVRFRFDDLEVEVRGDETVGITKPPDDE